jgi:DNA-directed RNA polymerase subunit beta'
MPEFGDFNAIRIGLASPELVRSWSYGEVTKPETINYRTLKPEKDGLFCERIFGPTKDFECHCGKYKRSRFKGIICDRCGVEVTRSKVRRERMGHIDLAAPVAHFWFARGTPSRLGLLLDLSPRNVERVLYFAQYLVTEVNEEYQQNRLRGLEEEMNKELEEAKRPLLQRIATLQQEAAKKVAALESKLSELRAQMEEERDKQKQQLQQKAQKLEKELLEHKGTKASSTMEWEGAVLVQQGKPLTQAAISSLRKRLNERLKEMDKGAPASLQGQIEALTGRIEQEKAPFVQEIQALQQSLKQQREETEERYQAQIEELEEIRPLLLLSEARYRELKERYEEVFRANIGAEAFLEVLQRLDLEELREALLTEVRTASGQRRKKAAKRLRIVESFRKSGNKPEWMILTVLPVLPPELRPMVQLDGGRFATSDLNDLYRRVINRNNRLRRLLELGAPDIIIRNEKRLLQEAVDALIDNGRRAKAVAGRHNHHLKSLSDMLRGKQGRFRQNLLGKRVDYSGRSVIVVGPQLQIHQCGLPKRMALELFKPFVMQRLVAKGLAHNIKNAKRIIERARPEVWDVLEEVIKTRPVLLNRAPTLHRLGIQAFEPVLIEGSAIQVHPLVCKAFNADFDGDQMAVHVPLSQEAVEEARLLMLSRNNLLSPASGEPLVAPTLDIVLGCYYLTDARPDAKGAGSRFSSFEEAKMAYDLGHIDLQAPIEIRQSGMQNGRLATTIGRTLFIEALPEELGTYRDKFHIQHVDNKVLKELTIRCHAQLGNEATARMLDSIKELGYHFATVSGITIGIHDLQVPMEKATLLSQADAEIAEVEEQYQSGLITEEERYKQKVDIWTRYTDKMTEVIQKHLPEFRGVYLMATSGAKGNIAQIKQMAGMRGLMSDPRGRIIERPIRSSFREGLSVLEYFISTHGARKGLADTALRTADSGYLTRRMIDVAQDISLLEEECGTEQGIWIHDYAQQPDKQFLGSLEERILGRVAAAPVADPTTGEILCDRNQEINEERARKIAEAKIPQVYVRSPMTCEAKRGLCIPCYGRSLGRGRPSQMGEAVGIIAAQSIGEPGTQLTMRTFHTGGIAGVDITSGLPRVEELFEARAPKGQAVLSEVDGVVEVKEEEFGWRVIVANVEVYQDEYPLPAGYEVLVKNGEQVEVGQVLAQPSSALAKREEKAAPPPLVARLGGKVEMSPRSRQLRVSYEVREEGKYEVSDPSRLAEGIKTGAIVKAGDALSEGHKNPQDILRIQGRDAVQQYLVEEVQKVYRSQGVTINDKHIEIIIRQMLRRVRIDNPGDTDFLPGQLVDRAEYENQNAKILAEGGEPATAQQVLLGITRASLQTESFLAAASFQETTRVLTEAALEGREDPLLGLKENVIIGRLIPARFDNLIVSARKPAAQTALEELAEEVFGKEGDLQEKSTVAEQAPS